MPRMVCHNLIPAITFFDLVFSPGFTVLGIDYFLGDPINLHLDEEGFHLATWISKSRQRAKEVFPKWIKEVREIYGRYH
jgi:hypothetical protein